ncbi:hypothetical protein [Halalkalibacter urbisdiaboli]|nr:hypothetical protein [Halalkalibacter urbisdiaboli]
MSEIRQNEKAERRVDHNGSVNVSNEKRHQDEMHQQREKTKK